MGKHHNVHYLIRTNVRLDNTKNGLRIRSFTGSRISDLVSIGNHIKKNRADAVIIHGLYNARLIPFFRLFTPARFYLQHHGEKETAPWHHRLTLRLTSGLASAYFFSGREVASAFVNAGLINPNKLANVTEGTCDFKPLTLQNPMPHNTIVFVGRLIESKNFITLLKALTQIPSPDYVVKVFYTDGTLEKSLKQFCVENGLQNKVVFIGAVPHAEMEAVFSEAQTIVSCSLYEAAGFSLIEAMACGVIPIVSSIPASLYLVKGLKHARVFEPTDYQSLSTLIEEVLRQGRNELVRQEIRAHFERRCSAEAIAEQVIKTITPQPNRSDPGSNG